MERGVQEAEGQVRASLGWKVDASECIAAFIFDYAPYLMKRLIQGNDCKVVYE